MNEDLVKIMNRIEKIRCKKCVENKEQYLEDMNKLFILIFEG